MRMGDAALVKAVLDADGTVRPGVDGLGVVHGVEVGMRYMILRRCIGLVVRLVFLEPRVGRHAYSHHLLEKGEWIRK